MTPQRTRTCEPVARVGTKQELAEVLMVSIRTFGYHLGNVLTRLGVRSRVELAARFRGRRDRSETPPPAEAIGIRYQHEHLGSGAACPGKRRCALAGARHGRRGA
ncbi:LuxR C-terminal-related transcriptional regulator [Streptomyces sp. NPDC015220]|uniref:LuxR C-terminal-related transcriptional regulator n=1 Tax=Streptomyces sp. NPDC015220 TaxID=3364947 RepID=UPI0036FDDBA6